MDEWLTTQEAQQVTGLSRTTLWIKRQIGEIRSKMVGRTPLYYREDCERIAGEKAEQENRDQTEGRL